MRTQIKMPCGAIYEFHNKTTNGVKAVYGYLNPDMAQMVIIADDAAADEYNKSDELINGYTRLFDKNGGFKERWSGGWWRIDYSTHAFNHGKPVYNYSALKDTNEDGTPFTHTYDEVWDKLRELWTKYNHLAKPMTNGTKKNTKPLVTTTTSTQTQALAETTPTSATIDINPALPGDYFVSPLPNKRLRLKTETQIQFAALVAKFASLTSVYTDFEFAYDARCWNTVLRKTNIDEMSQHFANLYEICGGTQPYDFRALMDSYEIQAIFKQMMELPKSGKIINKRLEIYYGLWAAGKSYAVSSKYPDAIVESADYTVTTDSFYRHFDLINGQQVFADTSFTTALKEGKTYILEEAMSMDPAVISSLKPILDGRDNITIPATNEVVHIHPDFKMIMVFNLETNGKMSFVDKGIASRAMICQRFERYPENVASFVGIL